MAVSKMNVLLAAMSRVVAAVEASHVVLALDPAGDCSCVYDAKSTTKHL